MQSHVQTRTLPDALNRVDEILRERATCLKESTARNELSHSFAVQPYPRFFDSWAFFADDYDEVIVLIRKRAPELVDRIEIPISDRDFTIVGHCSLDARFKCDHNGAYKVSHRLADGSRVAGAKVIGAGICLFSNGLLSIPTETSGSVYLFQPRQSIEVQGAGLASSAFERRGVVVHRDASVTFPRARTSHPAAYEWVTDLASEDALYRVANWVQSGEAFIDHNGLFARETSVVQMSYFSMREEPKSIVIDGPFVAFFADRSGIHAASWFDRDSFIFE